MKRLIAIDGYSLMYRAHYALAEMTTRNGAPTGALHGFCAMLLKLIELKPDYFLVAFDVHGPTFRHNKYQEYKAGRKPMPEELRRQIPQIKELLTLMGIKICELVGYEADDILGTIAKTCGKEGVEALLVTGDRDSFQLISDSTKVILTKRGITETIQYDRKVLYDQYGLQPCQMRDLKALMGDASDNIPGVAGVGEKTALKLLNDYSTLEGVYQNIDSISGKLHDRLVEQKDNAFLSYWLGTIDTDAPLGLSIDDCAFDAQRMFGAYDKLMELELRNIAGKLPKSSKQPTIASKSSEKIVLCGLDDLHKAIEKMTTTDSLAVLFGDSISFAVNWQVSYVVQNGDSLFDCAITPQDVASALIPIMTKSKVLTYDCKALYHYANTDDINVEFDAMIVDYLLHANRPAPDLNVLMQDALGINEYAAADLFRLSDELMRQLETNELMHLYQSIELPLAKVLYQMERTGVKVDREVLLAIHNEFAEQMKKLSARIFKLAECEFNILSTKQLATILFEKLNLPTHKKTKSGYSTDSESLEAIADKHEIVPLIIKYRFYSKLDSTFADGLQKCIDSDGRIRTHFQQCVTATGRLSSTDPNLQNIPVRTGEGREIRKAFVPSDGNVLVGADYSQIELRLLAHISGDEGLVNSFLNNEDIHRRTASEVFDVPFDAVTPEQRSAAKAVNFGIIYGISDFGLSTNLGISVKQAGKYIKDYLDNYPSVKKYMNMSVENAKLNGYAKTIFSRLRPIPELKQSNYNIRSFGERIAMNMPIQGSAADIMKMAMIDVANTLKKEKLDATLVLQVHDELIVDCSPNCADEVAKVLTKCMEKVAELKVPLIAEAKQGINWYETK
ncbi:MAG: DNA polymerase I [Eubacteriales bacterium]|nr:DNA polymerase I [Eubacteriales bacterium]